MPARDKPDSRVPVLLLGGELTLLAVMRMMGRIHLPSYSVCDHDDFSARSRWYRKLPAQQSLDPKPAELEAILHGVPFERAVLMPCADDWLLAAAELPASLRARFPSSVPSHDVIHTMVNKWRFAIAVSKAGIPRPRTLLIESTEHLAQLPEECFSARILKPLRSFEFGAKHRAKGFVVQNRAEATRLAGSIEFPILLQEYIPGPPTATYFLDGFVDRQGKVCAMFARRRMRMYPLDLGNSSLVVSVPLGEVGPAVKALHRLLKSVNYRGIFSAEFKRDPRDGLFKILEINARPWWNVDFAAHCGVDVCSMAYLDALEFPVAPCRQYRTGRRWMFAIQDLRAYRALGRPGSMALWMRSWIGADEAVFSWRDPGPGMALYQQWKAASKAAATTPNQSGSFSMSSVPAISKRQRPHTRFAAGDHHGSLHAVKPSGYRVVAIGGGTGLSTLLSGLRPYVAGTLHAQTGGPVISDLHAVTTVSDDGGSSGRLRRELNIAPPGDVRNCLVALSSSGALLPELFQYRFPEGSGLQGHSLGNLFLVALTDVTGDFSRAVRLAARMLDAQGRVVPATRTPVELEAVLADGSVLRGETTISAARLPIRRLGMLPACAEPLPETLDAISRADLITLGPGSLFTSLVPNLLVPGVASAIAQSHAVKVYVCNLMTQANESLRLTASDHLRVLNEHAGDPLFDVIVLNRRPLRVPAGSPQSTEPVHTDIETIERMGVSVHVGEYLDGRTEGRHNPDRLAYDLLRLAARSQILRAQHRAS
jgi:uncharacterized cofD-like protein